MRSKRRAAPASRVWLTASVSTAALGLGGHALAALPSGWALEGNPSSPGPQVVAATQVGSRARSGELVAFTRRPGTFSQVYVLDMGRRSVRAITRDSKDHYDPGWSDDGRRLAFSSRGVDTGRFYPSSIVIVDFRSGRRFVPLYDPKSSSGDLPHALLSPALSPDGGLVAFTDQGWNIAVVPSDRRSRTWRRLALGVDSSWSPDGRWIAFTRLIVGPSRAEEGVYLTSRGIWKMRPDGSNLGRVTSGSDWQPDWSPDGKRIAFSRRTRSGGTVRWNVLVTSASGRGDRRLASGSAPAWSPDGRRLAFERFRYEGNTYEGTDIYVMTDRGYGQRLLLRDAVSPDWVRS